MKLGIKVKIPKILKTPKIIGDALSAFDPRAERDGAEIIRLIKTFIGRSRSPVSGYGPYEGYAAEREQDPSKYPRGLKPERPVNLELTGEMLSYLGVEATKNNQSLNIGLIRPPEKILTIAQAHQSGVPKKNIPQRRFLPGKGEKFVPSIEEEIRALIDRNLARNVKKIF